MCSLSRGYWGDPSPELVQGMSWKWPRSLWRGAVSLPEPKNAGEGRGLLENDARAYVFGGEGLHLH